MGTLTPRSRAALWFLIAAEPVMTVAGIAGGGLPWALAAQGAAVSAAAGVALARTRPGAAHERRQQGS